jgi:hypothetical protein
MVQAKWLTEKTEFANSEFHIAGMVAAMSESELEAVGENLLRHPWLTGISLRRIATARQAAPRGGHLSGRSFGEGRRRLAVQFDVGELSFGS